MEERINKTAALVNADVYDSKATREYINGAPHIKHPKLRSLYSKLVVNAYDFASAHTSAPQVLDLGAGEGFATLPFLALGAKVTAVDISKSQLQALQAKCTEYAGKLKLRSENVFEALKSMQSEGILYDLVVANSFLHHIPDYLSLVREAVKVLSPYGQFFSFQDPLRYDSLGRFSRTFDTLAYFSWRIFQGDVVNGIKNRIRRARGVYLEDYAEYHVIRDGVDQDAIYLLFEELGFGCNIIRYFSTQSRIWQPVGTALDIENTFAIIARRSDKSVF